MAMQSEFQVVLLAGGIGSRMYPLSDDIPKCMLSVANRPLISYQLEFLEQAGFEEIIIVTSSRSHGPLSTYVQEQYRGKLKSKFESFDEGMGTAQVIYRLKQTLVSDFIVISGDLIVSNPRAFLHRLADVHRTENAAITVLMYRKPEPKDAKAAKKDTAPFYVGIGQPGDRLAVFAPAADLDGVLALRKGMLRRMPRLAVRADLLDAHLYIVSNWTLRVPPAEKQDLYVSLQSELLPALVRGQFRAAWRDQAEKARNETTGILPSDSPDEDALKCFVHVLDDSIYCHRVNTLDSYASANNDVANHRKPSGFSPLIPLTKNNFVDAGAEIDPKTQVGPDCVVGFGSSIGEKCSIKKSVIGNHCKIGSQCKIVNSVVMDHVTIEDGAIIHSSIISSNCYVRTKCQVTDSVLGVSFELPAENRVDSEQLTNNASPI